MFWCLASLFVAVLDSGYELCGLMFWYLVCYLLGKLLGLRVFGRFDDYF